MAGKSGNRGLYTPTGNQTAQVKAARLVSAIEQAGEGIVIADTRGVIQYANPQFESMVGLEPGQTEGRHIRSVQSEYQNDDQFREMLRVVVDGQPWQGRWDLETASGGRRIIETRVSPLRDEQGQVTGFVGVHHDVTREADLEEKLRQAQKMEAVGRLAGGVAHDFNNLLTAIMGNAQILRMHLDEQPAQQAKTLNILQAAKRAARLTGKLMAFAQLGATQLTSVDIHELLTDLAADVGHEVQPHIRVSLELRAEPSVVLGDGEHLREALAALADNACEAMPDGGGVTFETSNVQVPAPAAESASDDLLAGRYIRISVLDEGRGMAPEVLAHAFEPFYTTKTDTEGAGMGLAHAYGCCKSHGGSVRIQTQPGRGTRVDVYLPCGQPAGLEDSVPESNHQPAGAGGGTILIVDDEASVREVACDALNEFGYQVFAFESGQDALAFFEKHHQQVDLVLLDLIMPRMDGRQTYQRLRRIDPDVRAVICTGYSTSEMANRVMGEGVLDFLAKPYRLSELAEMVQRYVPHKA